MEKWLLCVLDAWTTLKLKSNWGAETDNSITGENPVLLTLFGGQKWSTTNLRLEQANLRRVWFLSQRGGCCCTSCWSPPEDPSCFSSDFLLLRLNLWTWKLYWPLPGTVYSMACQKKETKKKNKTKLSFCNFIFQMLLILSKANPLKKQQPQSLFTTRRMFVCMRLISFFNFIINT